jgi:hypothetical protein
VRPSVITLLVLLDDDFAGGAFTTDEVDVVVREYTPEHPLSTDDGRAFVSHKYPVGGVRRSLVIELWEVSAKLSM